MRNTGLVFCSEKKFHEFFIFPSSTTQRCRHPVQVFFSVELFDAVDRSAIDLVQGGVASALLPHERWMQRSNSPRDVVSLFVVFRILHLMHSSILSNNISIECKTILLTADPSLGSGAAHCISFLSLPGHVISGARSRC